MVFKWREDHTPLFLDLFKNFECLWNNKSLDYRNKFAREKAIQNIVKQLNFPSVTDEDIKLKIKSIRTRYSAELAKVLQSERSGVDIYNVYVPKLFWYQQADSFLRNVCTPKNSVLAKINKAEVDFIKVYIPVEKDDKSNKEKEIETGPERLKRPEKEEEEEEKEISWEIEQDEKKETESNRVRKRSLSDDFQCMESAVEKLSRINDAKETEFDFYCKSLAVQLNNMPLYRALICQHKLQKVMFEERLYQLTKNSASGQEPGSANGHT